MTAVQPDAKCDLVLERVVPVPVDRVWAAWTEPGLVVQWFTPAPWKTIACDIDLRPGGRFDTVMESPDGDQHRSRGCVLEAIPNERLTFTSALTEGFRPITPQNGPDDLPFTGIIAMTAEGDGTRYTVTAVHESPEVADRHRELGFHEGWGAALDQLVALFT